jgi:hypothetical protein
LWSNAFAAGIVPERWRTLIDPPTLALIGRSLATRGQAVAHLAGTTDISLTFATDWDLSTRQGRPVAYRLQIPEAGGGFQVHTLADETIDIAINRDIITPWHGQSPLRKASLSADLLAAIEGGLVDAFNGSWANQILATPELSETQRDRLEAKLKGTRGGLALVESTRTLAAGSPPPQNDWRPEGLTPDTRGLEPVAHLEATRNSIMSAFGCPPLIFSAGAQSAAIRESQRHLVLYTLAPIAKIAATEIGRKLNDPDFSIDLVTPLAAADSAGRARAVGVLVGNGMPLEDALKLVGWGDQA